MARRTPVAEMQDNEQAFAAEPGMAPAPEGSAERVKDDPDLDFDSGQPIGESVGPDDPDEPEERTVLVNGYDARGEAVSGHVPMPSTAQPQMPGFEKPELWDRFEGRKVNKVILTFAGTCDLSQDPALCKQLHLRNEVSFSISGEVTGKAFKLRTDKNGVTTVDGVATLNVTEVVSGDERDLEAVAQASAIRARQDLIDEAAELLELIETSGDGGDGAADREERFRQFLQSIVLPEDPADDPEPSALEASLAEAGVNV